MKSQNVKFTIEYSPLSGNAKQFLKTIVTIEDRDDYIYYSYQIRDNEGQLIAGKSIPFSKSLIDAGN